MSGDDDMCDQESSPTCAMEVEEAKSGGVDSEEEEEDGVAVGLGTVDVVTLGTVDVGTVMTSILKFLDGICRILHEEEEWLVERNKFLLEDLADARSTIARDMGITQMYLAELDRVLGALHAEQVNVLEHGTETNVCGWVADSPGMQSIREQFAPWTDCHGSTYSESALRKTDDLCSAGTSAHWEIAKDLGHEIWKLFSSFCNKGDSLGAVASMFHKELWRVSSIAYKVEALSDEMCVARNTITHARRFGHETCRWLRYPIGP